LRRALAAHGVDHAAVVAGVSSIRRQLLRGENDCVVVCIALDEPTLTRHGEALRQLLADQRCFPAAVRTVGLLGSLGLNRQAAELGCDVYVDDSARAAEAIRLLEDDAQTAKAHPARGHDAAAPGPRWRVRGRWIVGSPGLPPDFASLVGVEHAVDRETGSKEAFSPDRVNGSGRGLGDRMGPS
jgi:hypothetical protein